MNKRDSIKNSRRNWVTLMAASALSLRVGAQGSNAAPKELRIGFQKSSISLLVLKQHATLARRLSGTKVSWIEFPAGPQLLEALAVGSLDLGATGDSPPVFAQAAGKDLIYVGAEPAKPDTSAILVKPDAPLRTLADLKGKKVALQRGSSAHFLLVSAVAKGGLNWTDITPVYLPPADARAAFERGSVDAWVIWDPYYAAAEIAGNTRVLVTGRGLSSNNSFYLASRGFVEQHGPALLTVFKALSEVDAYVTSHRKETAQLVSDFSGLSLSTVHRVLARRPASAVKPLTPLLINEQQQVADAFFALGLIPKPIRVRDIVWQPGQALPSATL